MEQIQQSVYMYFKTTEELQASYTIHCNNYADFSQTLNSNTLSSLYNRT